MTRDVGREIAVYRALPPPGFLAIFGVAALLLVALVAVVRPDPVMMVVVASAPLLALLGFFIGGWFDKIRVCEHGLRLGFSGDIQVPYGSVDPGRVYAARGFFVAKHVPAAITSTRATAGRMIILNGASEGGLAIGPAGPGGPGPYGWYLLGVRSQEAFLADLERAMVADGQPAQGLAAATLQLRSVRATSSTAGPALVIPRGPDDPPLGVGAPAPVR